MASQNYADVILADSPTGYWKLNEEFGGDDGTNSSLTAVDYSGNGNDAPFNNGGSTPAWTHTQVDQSPFLAQAPEDSPTRFLGGFAQTSASLGRAGGTTMTLEAWIVDDRSAGLIRTYLHADDSGSHRWFQFRHNSSNQLDFLLFDSGGSVHECTGSRNICDGRLHHIVGVYDGANMWVYVDGAVDGQLTATFTITSQTSQIRIGSGQNVSSFTGVMGHAAFYAGALPAGRVLSHYTAGLTAPVPKKIPRIVIQPPPPSTPKSDTDTASLSLETQNVNGAFIVQDTDSPSLADIPSVAAALSSSDTASEAESAASNNPSSSDTLTFAETSVNAISVGPTPTDSEIFIASSAGSLAVAVAASETFTFAEDPPAVSTPNHLALDDSDEGTLSELGTNSSGGVANSFYGVVLALDDDAGAADPTWTRFDDPHGAS